MARLEQLLGQLPEDDVLRGRAFERVCKWYLESEPMYRQQLRHVYLWRDWPGRWGADKGIDLVAETHEGRLWAIQAKAVGIDHAVVKREVDSFLSESSRELFSFRLLIATTNTIGSNAREVLDAQEKPVDLRLLADLEVSEVDWPTDMADLTPRPPAPKEPLPHSLEAVDRLVQGLASKRRGQLILPCGTGKTLIALWTAERLPLQRILVTVPSLALMSQTIREWTRNATSPFRLLAVCSDDSVVDRDEAMTSTGELGLPVTTDTEEIVRFLEGPGRSVVFATYHSTPVIAQALAQGFAFDLVIADEAHRCVASSGVFSTILDDALIPSHRRLFMTATPRYLSASTARTALDEGLRVFSMDDESAFGPVLHRMSFAEALDRGLLSDYRVVVIGVDGDDDEMRAVRQRQLVSIPDDVQTDAGTLAGQVGVLKAIHSVSAHRALTFHSRVERARLFSHTLASVATWMSDAGLDGPESLWSDYVSGAMSAGRRQSLLNRLREGSSDVSILSNAKCLVEGVDVPAIDAVAFVDPKQSQIEIIQAVGRALRSAPGKTHGTVVVPVFLSGDDGEDPFRPVFQVLRAIRAHDDVLGEELDGLRRQLGRAPGVPVALPDRIALDLPTEMTTKFIDAVKVRIIEGATFGWHFNFGLLQLYIDREGGSRVPPEHEEAGVRLGEWVRQQRLSYNAGRLSSDRAKSLEAMPGWVWDLQRDLWERAYEQVLVFVEREGTSRVPAEHVEGTVPIGQWVQSQRSQYSRGRLAPRDIERLASLPQWSWNLVETRWEEYLAKVRKYLDNRANLVVDESFRDADGFRPARWWEHQVRRYRQGSLNPPKRALLESIPGWTVAWPDKPGRVAYRGKARDRWIEMFTALEEFAQANGHIKVTREVTAAGSSEMYGWISRQRQLRRKNALDDELIAMLETLPGWRWDPWQPEWDEAFGALQKYTERMGHASPSLQETEDEFKLGRWVAEQRRQHKARDLPHDRAAKLAALPGWRWGR